MHIVAPKDKCFPMPTWVNPTEQEDAATVVILAWELANLYLCVAEHYQQFA